VPVSNGNAAPAATREIGWSSSIPPRVGVVIVITYFLMFGYWAQLLHFDLTFVLQRVCFLAIILTILVSGLRLRLSETIGRLDVPGRAHPKLLALMLLVAVVIRLALKLVAQSLAHGTDIRTLTAWNFAYECIIPPLNEEPVFRGLLLMSLLAIFQPRWGQAVVLAAFTFSWVHPARDLEQQIATFLLGCLLGVMFVRTRSLSSCMVVHAVWNMMVFVRLPIV